MGKKYSINSAGYIVAERDIYSLGGFIPKGSVGGKVASEKQLSQEGECWLAGGDISARPDVWVKDNAYIGDFVGATGMHTDGVTEFSGNTLIPGKIIVRNPIADPVNNFFAKDSFIGISMDVLCGPEANTTAFPFGQGLYSVNSAKGTLFANMVATPVPANSCRASATLRLGKETKIYVPVGLRCQVLWGYYNATGQEAYSGRYTGYAPGLHTISDPVYGIACLHFWKNDGTAMTPANLLATGAKILGHISQSANADIRPESVSGEYAMVNSSLVAETDNFGLNTTQLRFLAGSMYDTTMYTKTDRRDYKLYGTFWNVERLEYTRYLSDSYRTAATRDTYISAYDCPLLRVDNNTFDNLLAGKGDLVLRNCIVPKAEFQNDVINGNTYEDIDFSYANEDLGFTMTGYTRFISSHKQGIYRMIGGPTSTGFASHKGNLADTARLYQAEVYLPLDGDLVESGSYSDLPGTDYKDAKIAASNRVRMARPLATFGAIFPSMPTGYAVNAIIYLDSSFIITSVVSNPTSISTDDPYFILVFRKGDGNTPLPVNEFIALNITLRIIDHTKVPEITGSAYVGAGCTVRGDVKLIGDPYVNRLLDVNAWEWGSINEGLLLNGWEAAKNPSGGPTDVDRRRFKEVIPVEPGAKISCNSGYWFNCYVYAFDGTYLGTSNWSRSWTVTPDRAAFIGIILKKSEAVGGTSYIEDSDISLANVKYVRAFKKRRYITNELDRNSSEDILIGPDYWEQGGLSIAESNAGKPYEELKNVSPYRIRLKRPLGLGAGYRVTFSSVYSFGTSYYDAVTKLLYGSTSANMDNSLLSLVGRITDSETAPITPADVTAARLVIEFTPTPRIIVPYGSSTLFISGPKIRMYDNAVLSRNLTQEGEIVLQGDAVMGYDFSSRGCLCSNGHDDAIIKKP